MNKVPMKRLIDDFYGPHTFVPTIGGRGEHHLDGLVGNLWRINNPDSVHIGDCFLYGRLKSNDLFLCIAHSGDCFQTYMYVEEYTNCFIGKPEITFGSYGIGDSTKVQILDEEYEVLKSGGRVERK